MVKALTVEEGRVYKLKYGIYENALEMVNSGATVGVLKIHEFGEIRRAHIRPMFSQPIWVDLKELEKAISA